MQNTKPDTKKLSNVRVEQESEIFVRDFVSYLLYSIFLVDVLKLELLLIVSSVLVS